MRMRSSMQSRGTDLARMGFCSMLSSLTSCWKTSPSLNTFTCEVIEANPHDTEPIHFCPMHFFRGWNNGNLHMLL